MVAPSLVGPDVEGSEELLAELDREQLPIVAAFWYFASSSTGWRLVVASPVVDHDGALPVYQRVQAALDRLHETRLSVLDTFVVGEDDPVVHILRGLSSPLSPGGTVTINFPTLAPGVPYLPEEATGVTVYPVHVVPEPDAATVRENTAVRTERPVHRAATVGEKTRGRRSEKP